MKEELQKIQLIKSVLGKPSARVRIGIGDDAAVLEPAKGSLVVSTDAMVEGVHFDFNFISPRQLGHKALAAALSDLAAMNAKPLYALFSLAVPKSFTGLEDFYQGARDLAAELMVDVVGGDLTGSKGGLFIDVVVIGESENPISRSGARPGDTVAVSGTPGFSAKGLRALQSGDLTQTEAIRAHLEPRPRFDLLEKLRGCTSLIDISDGISTELYRLSQASKVGFEIQEACLPQPVDDALYGGEDYELLATFEGVVPTGFTEIGKVTATGELTLVQKSGQRINLEPHGFDHFA